MRSHHLEPKVMAKALRAALQERQIAITHGAALEIVAAQHGAASWNVLAAEDRAPVADDIPVGDGMRFSQTCPIMRIFDEGIAKEFYLDFLGFHLDWEHRYGENFPLYAQVSRSGLTLHLSGHHGDATPGSSAFVRMQGVEAFQRELTGRDYKHNKPGLKDEPYGLVMTVTDPFNNRIHFCQDKPDA
ncbi:VOC family protein [Methylobacterium sp. W2]|nr:glyoxalase superfamily protein [Methylobacterium sp. W2]MCC0805164.1 VOC family protein [Methylobacterium sp. W2]